jgi:acetolactate synthase I/II/III large subunit
MIMVVGQVETSVKEREAFHELDYHGAFGNMIKWTVEVDDPDRITEFLSRAFYTASSSRPGPVVVALPKDVLSEHVTVANAPPFEPVEPSQAGCVRGPMIGTLPSCQSPRRTSRSTKN